jgi:putative glutamine amidotransferase
MSKPIIGMTSGQTSTSSWSPLLVGVRRSYIDAIIAAGGIPMLLPPVDAGHSDILDAYFDHVDGILIPGGGDIQPHLYGADKHPKTDNIDVLRDDTELYLARKAAASGKPLLGICRGLQVINVALGGTLIQDLPDEVGGDLAHNESATREDWTHMAHTVRLEADSQLRSLLQTDTIAVNSLHHQAIGTVGTGVRPVAWTHDGVIEAIEGTGPNFMVAVQCHPETLRGEADPRWQAMFDRFVQRCRDARTVIA